ncbi:MAG: aldo/keto reductase [Actinomycetales bacterium]|nr:aldo/keto reductase [Actinomycetales bacterium]
MNTPADQPVLASGTFTLGSSTNDPLTIRRLGFGAMRITGPGIWGEPADRTRAIQVLQRARDLGVDFIDTADSYGPNVSEDLIRAALYPYSGNGNPLIIATKGGLTRQGPDAWAAVGRPEYLRQCVQMSLRRLGIDRIDLWQLHRIDGKVPEAEQFGVIAQMINEGLIRHVGLSEVGVAELERARAVLPIVSVQNLYHAGNRQSEEVLQYCEQHSIGFIPWFPLGNRELVAPDGPLGAIAQRHSCTPAQVALAWLLQRSPVILPIPGTGSLSHLEENCSAALVHLDPAAMAEIDQLV